MASSVDQVCHEVGIDTTKALDAPFHNRKLSPHVKFIAHRLSLMPYHSEQSIIKDDSQIDFLLLFFYFYKSLDSLTLSSSSWYTGDSDREGPAKLASVLGRFQPSCHHTTQSLLSNHHFRELHTQVAIADLSFLLL